MNRSAIALGLFIGCAVLAGTVNASSNVTAEQQRRSDLVVQIVEKWGDHVQGAYSRSAEAWGKDMVPLLMSTPLDSLQRAANARTFEGMNDALLVRATPAPVSPRVAPAGKRVSGAGFTPAAKSDDAVAALGDAASDLVYVPVTPCRVIDTRLAGGAIPTSSLRGFNIASATDYTAQGGAATNCGVGNISGVAAAVINFTVVSPATAGYITAFPFGGTQPLAATVNYGADEISGNLAIVPLDSTPAGNDISVFSFAQSHLVGDIVGYFVPPQATALQCISTFTSQSVPANDIFDFAIPACPASYAVTGAGCRTPNFNQVVWAINGLAQLQGSTATFCSGTNVTNDPITVEGTAQCCRVPGR